MRKLLVVSAALLCASCVAHRNTARVSPPAPVEREADPGDDGGEREDSYREAAEFSLLRRAPEGMALPVERYLEAKRHAERMPLLRHSAGKGREAALGSWQPLGPGNIGGRTRSILINPANPKIMYAGAVGGGVWKSTDGAQSWFPLTDLLPSIGIGALAMDPQNPDILYAGTGEYYTGSTRGDSIRGLGIFRTTDGGATWSQLPATATSSFYYTNKLAVSPANSQHIYAATYGGVWASLDGGVTWKRVLDRTSPNNGCQDLVMRSDQATDYVFAACGMSVTPQTVIYRNVDAGGGGSWEQVFSAPNMSRTSLAIAPSNQSTIYAVSASAESGDYHNGLLGVYRSQSNGDKDSWQTRVNNQDANRLNTVLFTNPREGMADICSGGKAQYSNQGDYDNAIAVDPLNPDVVWVGGIDVFRSDDGGANWGIAGFWQASAPQLVHADVHAFVFQPGYNGGDNQRLIVATDGGIFSTDNALAATAQGDRAACSPYPTQIVWTSLNNSYAATQFYHGSVYPGGGAYWGGTQDNGAVRGSDGAGANAWRRVISGDGGFTAIDPTDPNLIYGESQNLAFSRSVNGGITFSSALRGITENTSNFLFITPFEMDPSQPKRLYLGGRTLWKTTDGALNWSAASAPVASGSISAIAIAPSAPAKMVMATSTGLILRNSDALSATDSTVWSSSSPRTGYVSRLAFDPGNPDIVYATYSQFKASASQNHVYKSTDGGATWTGIDGSGDTGLPDIPVFSIIVDPQNTSNLYLGTDLGVFFSPDGGNTWSRDDAPFANTVTEVLTLDRSSGTPVLYAFTHGRGVWKTPLPGNGPGCSYALSTGAVKVPVTGGSAEVKVDTADGCVWSALNVAGTAGVSSPAVGKGPGSFNITAGSNTGAARTSRITVQDRAVAVQQDGALNPSGNDDQQSAFDLSPLPAIAIEDTRGMTEAADDPVHSCTKSKDAKTVWFQATAPNAGTLSVNWYAYRPDTGTDAGTVLTVYDDAGKELACSVLPQSAGLFSRTITVPVKDKQRVLIEVSATTFGAPAGAEAVGGTLLLTAQMR